MSTLPKHIFNALKQNKTSLGEHPSYPPEEEEKFIIYLLEKTFEDLCGKIGNIDYESIKKELARILAECRKIEKNNKEALENICANIINDLFQIPQDTIDITMNIVDKVDTSNEKLLPEKTVDFSFDDIEDMNNLTNEIYKRRMLNALVEGASLFYMNYIGNYIKEIFEINSDLPAMYKKIVDYNNVLLFYEKDKFDDKRSTNGGKVDVTITSSNAYPTIKAEGLLCPILVEETIKGLLELAIAHGLPKKMDKAKYVISKSDFKLAEMWDMRLGLPLWCLIEEEMKKCGYDMIEIGINFFFMELAEMDCETFNKSLQEVFARTRKGREILTNIAEEILYDKEKDDFDNYITTKNDSIVQLNDDDCYTPEELLVDDEEDYFTPEELINDNVEYGVFEEVSRAQMRNAVNRLMTDKTSVKIGNNAHGEITTLKMNNKRNNKSSLSRIVLKEFNNGRFEQPKINNGTQDKLVRVYKNMLFQYTNRGFQIVNVKNDRIINKPCKYLFSRNIPVIKCMYIETDDLLSVTPSFDLEQVKHILDAVKDKFNLPDSSFYKLPDKEMDKVRVKRPRINQRTNWDWIENGKPRPFRKFDNKLTESVKKNLSESEWNYHFSKLDSEHNLKPYHSDSKIQMGERDTGHFGSGTYFSTYPNLGMDSKYANNENPNFIRLGKRIYRVDFDLYKNLYRVRSKRQGDILYTMCRYLNGMYNNIAYMGHFNKKESKYKNSEFYQIIKGNAEALNLKCPSYYELTRMAENHTGAQSFSTLFMEYNGYNGVNVSGVDYYDNSLHGSVIYDLSKIDTEMEEVKPKSLYNGFNNQTYNSTIAQTGYDDAVGQSLAGEYIQWQDKLNDIPFDKALRLLKNITWTGNIISTYTMSRKLNENLLKRYLRILYASIIKKLPHYDDIECLVTDTDNVSDFIDAINKTKSYYWLNIEPKYNESLLITMLRNAHFDWDLSVEEENKQKKQYLDMLLSYIKRDLTTKEKNYINTNYYNDGEY